MKQKAESKTRLIVYTIFGILFGVFLMYGIMYKFPAIFQETVTKIERDVTVTDEGIADAVEKVYNAVVIVSNYKGDSLYSFGSGFVYKKDDNKFYIVTNHHVIADGDNYKITYEDGENIEAKLLGSDKYADIAILEVKAKDGVEPVTIGKTETLRVGDTTFTVGAPLDNVYSWTVTRGIISGKERQVPVSLSSSSGSDFIINVLQTDAAVNSGNSGGPLCNSNGEVIGVISAKIKSTGVEGMGFAIPIESVIEKAEAFINGESSEYPYLGVGMINVSDALSVPLYSRYIPEGITSGVIINNIDTGSVAEKAKLKVGDIITKINDVEISNKAYLRYELYKHKIGDTIKITYVRNGKEDTVSAKLTSNVETM